VGIDAVTASGVDAPVRFVSPAAAAAAVIGVEAPPEWSAMPAAGRPAVNVVAVEAAPGRPVLPSANVEPTTGVLKVPQTRSATPFPVNVAVPASLVEPPDQVATA
jgi:hypothetical protein